MAEVFQGNDQGTRARTALVRLEDPDRIFAPARSRGSAEYQKAGKVRYVGFTGHKDPLVHLRMLEVAAENKFRFDTLQMPLNVMDAHFRVLSAKSRCW